MRIGITGSGTTVDAVVAQAIDAEAEGFSALWYSSMVCGDPLIAMALAARATTRIELGTAVLQTYPCHPLLQANRVAAAANAMGRPGLTIGIGPSHQPIVEGVFGLSYDGVGANTEEYVRILTGLLRNEIVDTDGRHWTTHSEGRMTRVDHRVPVLLSALGPRLLRVAGAVADGTVTFLASAAVIETQITPRITEAAAAAGRLAPRIVAGLPVAVHDDVDEARAAHAGADDMYRRMPVYRRVVELGGATRAAELAIVGDEAAVTRGLQRLIDAGATDISAAPFPVGDDREARRASLRRTRDLLASLCG